MQAKPHHQAIEQARAILADPSAYAHRPQLRRLAALVALSAEGHAPAQRKAV